jgi:formate dehydrogenase
MVFTRSFSRLARPVSSWLAASFGPQLTPRGAPLLRQNGGIRRLTATATQQGKVLLVLYDVSEILIPRGDWRFNILTL